MPATAPDHSPTPAWEAIIVGGGPAGCAAAYDLAQAGRRVLIVDKAEFPRPKACAGGLTMRAYTALRYSVAPVVRRVAKEIVLESDGPGTAAKRSLPVRRNKPLCMMTVRAELDEYCLARTLEAGAEFRRIPAIHWITEGSSGVTMHIEGGEQLEARYLIGADGVHSRVRALTQGGSGAGGAPRRQGFAIEANVWMGESAPPPLTFDFTVPGGYGWLFPRNDHVNVGLYVYDAGGAHTLNRAALAEYIAARCGGREFYGLTGQYLGFGAESEAAATGRVLLAGDAGGFADPLTGEGIYGAIRSGQAAAAAVLTALPQGTGAATAADAYRRATAPLRRDLGVATDAAKSFYRAPARAFSLLRYAPVRAAAIQTFTYGSSITRLAFGVRALARIVPMPAAPQAERKKLPHSRQSA